jgi:hypothetical protein
MSADKDEIVAEEFNRLRGRLLGLIESWGLPDKQESGAKNTLKSLSYDAQARISELLNK